jgi:hypothetical protein
MRIWDPGVMVPVRHYSPTLIVSASRIEASSIPSPSIPLIFGKSVKLIDSSARS